MALIDTNQTPEEIAKVLWRTDLLDDVKAVEEETSVITVIKNELGHQWIEETRDLDNMLVSKRIEDHNDKDKTITHRVYDGTTLYKQWIANDQTQQITIEVQHVRSEYFSKIREKSGQITLEKGVIIILDALPYGLDCLVCGLDKDGNPNGESVLDTKGAILSASLDMVGNFILSGRPEHPPVALIYMGEVRVDYPKEGEKK